ncbi:hypothetical protein BASA50_001096 [Batrachochytrium salamandrivorans]|uniref:Uncharacterized protein n=1 Tax=Batrachochytrium salamandrivorans TaxID=1357716 RepID=A0ABQ8ERJ7_9FUNG|nr:hypothetical protein BASA50_001096 [Batrachochytrium salamandrivorans]KAH9248135.1 hypothetical protein BASA81_014209 [Batrachochytrium salamandrivorans]KAJ1339129.1 hypothetical protein BSLG_006267 [Batrachochytrium salamandrivorans]
MHQHRQQDSTFADPVQLATVCVSLLHDEAYEALLAISSEFIKDRYTLLFRPSTPSPLRFFTWQSDNIKAILEMCDVRLNPPAPESARYKMWDSETLQAAVPFGANSSHIRNDSGFGMSNPLIQKDTPTPELLLPFGPSAMGASTLCELIPNSCGVVILLLHSPGRWVYHNLIEAPDGWDIFSNNWHRTVHEARVAFESTSKLEEIPIEARAESAQSQHADAQDEASYWDSYAVVGENTPIRDHTYTQAAASDDEDDSYWNSYV